MTSIRRIAAILLQRRGGILAVLTGSLLAACATTPQAPGPQTTASTQSAPEQAKKKPAQKRGGGYYLDDGPDETPPENLDAVPDAEPKFEPLNRFANNPYNVFGVDYTPATEVKPYKARGVASWYGKKFHGQRTSSGEAYDMYAMTAAHPTLPIPSYARVTNLNNNKSIVVRINDRGPFHSNRLIDLSYTAAYKLGYVNNGSTSVEVESIVPEGVEVIARNVPPIKQRSRPARKPVTPAPVKEPDPIAALASTEVTETNAEAPPPSVAPATATEESGASTAISAQPKRSTVSTVVATAGSLATHAIFLQLGAFSTAANAEGFRSMVQTELAWLSDKLEVLASNGRFRLHAGPFSSDAEARSVASQISRALQLKPFVVLH